MLLQFVDGATAQGARQLAVPDCKGIFCKDRRLGHFARQPVKYAQGAALITFTDLNTWRKTNKTAADWPCVQEKGALHKPVH